MADQLNIYNEALLLLGERSLASLTEAREPRFVFDQIWNNKFVDDVLCNGFWKVAVRTIVSQYDPNITPPFGYRRAHTNPPDNVKTRAVASDEYFAAPLTRYSLEAGKFYVDFDTIYISYISNDPLYGGNLAAWGPDFTRYVAAYLAVQAAPKITGSMERIKLVKEEMESRHTEAQSQDAMEGPTAFPPAGTWSRSRQGRTGRRDRGRTQQLIG